MLNTPLAAVRPGIDPTPPVTVSTRVLSEYLSHSAPPDARSM